MYAKLPHFYLDPAQDYERANQCYLNMLENAPSKWLPSVCQAQLLKISHDMFPFGIDD